MCYTWWTLAAAQLAEPVIRSQLQDLFDLPSLEAFVHLCMGEHGGIAPHPEDDPETLHLLLGTGVLFKAKCLIILWFILQDVVTTSRGSCFMTLPTIAILETKDPFHTFFGLAGLSLISGAGEQPSATPALEKMEPTLVLPMALLGSKV